MNRRRWEIVALILMWTALVAALFWLSTQTAEAGSRGVLSWRHDRDELFVTSPSPVRFRCTWDSAGGWRWRTHGWTPGVTYIVRSARNFDCWRVG